MCYNSIHSIDSHHLNLKIVDVDECEEDLEKCGSNAQCQNTIGNFTCKCLLGYEGSGINCTDIDECLPQRNPCHINGTCKNTSPFYICECKEGYKGNGKKCTGK